VPHPGYEILGGIVEDDQKGVRALRNAPIHYA